MDAINERPLKVGDSDSFALDVSRWLDGEALTQHSVVGDDLVQVDSTSLATGRISIIATGLAVGIGNAVFTYETPTRKKTFVMGIKVIEP